MVKRGNVTVKGYCLKQGCPNQHYVICYYEAGKRMRRYFSNPVEAKTEAALIADKLNRGELAILKLTGVDRESYLAATAKLSEAKVPLHLAVEEYVAARKMLADLPLLEAVRFAVEHRQLRFTPKKLPDVVEEILHQKESKGRSHVYLKDLKSRLARFAEAFQNVEIHTLTTAHIEKWLRKLKVSARSKNNYLRALRTLFRFAVTRKYLTTNHPGATEVEWTTESEGEIEIFTPDEMLRLLESAEDAMIPYLAISAFSGIRSAELQRLNWSDVKFDRNLIEIKPAKAKTRSRRLVPISENLREWLLPYARKSGQIAPYANMAKQLAWLAEEVDAKWKSENPPGSFCWRHNALRHSFVSYRMALIQNENKVAEEAGNSPAMIFRHYRELVTLDEARKWFAIRPVTEGKVVSLRSAAITT